jgi:hypothetical protein
MVREMDGVGDGDGWCGDGWCGRRMVKVMDADVVW